MKYRDNFLPIESKGRCSCGKVCLDKKTALTKRNYLGGKGLEGKGKGAEFRIYQCPESNWWHLTKKAKWRT